MSDSPDTSGPASGGERQKQAEKDMDRPGPWEEFVGERVVIDTPTRYIYLGTLTEYSDHALVLEDVDVHDSEESESTKEVYIMKAAEQGIRVNRKRVMVPEHRVLSISTLEDTVVY